LKNSKLIRNNLPGDNYKRRQMYKILNTWHPINGRMAHLVQLYHSHIIKYYTNGRLVKIEKVETPPLWADDTPVKGLGSVREKKPV